MKLSPSSCKLLTFPSPPATPSPTIPKLQLYPCRRSLVFFPRLSLSCKSIADDFSFAPKMTTSEEWELTTLTALSPLDGRYRDFVKELSPYMSEFGLIYYRVLVEVKWLLKLSRIPEIVEVPEFSEEATTFLEGVIDGFGIDDALQVKKIECVTNHDVKAVEYFLKRKCGSQPEIAKPASPTTLGKEMANFVARLSYLRRFISRLEIMGKFAGASGNYNAHLSAYPSVDWPEIAKDFVESLGLCFNPCVTQVGHDDLVISVLPMEIRLSLLFFLRQITKAGEIGSSTMPHKVNPINFENSEGNLGKANADLTFLAQKLPISRWQRDLTDSTVLRNVGEVLAHSLLAYKSALKGIEKLQVNEARFCKDLDQCWELLAEPIQTVMRRYGVPEPYEKLKVLTRGRTVTKDGIRGFIEGLEIPQEAKTCFLEMTPHSYIGAAVYLANTSR